MRYKFSDWMETKRQRFLEMDLPDQAKPVIIVFGGTFNPVHKEHMGIAIQAKEFAESQGYAVSKVIVAPVGDGYARSKLGEDFIPLKDRVAMINIAAQSYPGVMATEEPGKYGDTLPKMKRTMLADWAREQFGDVTIMSICGEDSCPPGFGHLPQIYTGTEPTHQGYWYIGMPRDDKESISSSKIRNAIKTGQPASQWLPPGVEEYLKRIYNPATNKPQRIPKANPPRPVSQPGEQEPVSTMRGW